MGLSNLLRNLRHGLTPRLAWDLLMVYLAFLNLGLILFDFTYFWLRPFYLSHVPAITRLYDPVKGIEPQPVTTRYLELVDGLRQAVPTDDQAAVEPLLAELRSLSMDMLDENPFERSGQERSLARLTVAVRTHLEGEGLEPGSPSERLKLFWSWDPERLSARVERFDTTSRRDFEANFHRAYGLDGNLTDYFWAIDSPFLLLFAVEFFIRWFLALRRRTYAKWFFFPIFNWYDLLGIIPLAHFRLFRLFRIASIYVRLYRSDRTGVGDDFISRTVKYFANIISEEISDMVALRILSETADELEAGTHRRIIRTVVEPHREALASELTARTRELLASAEVREQARGFLDANLERAAETARTLKRLPLPERVVRPLVTLTGRAVFDSIADTMSATLRSEEGKVALEAILIRALDGLVDELTEGELEQIVREISLEVIREVSETVAVRKWALPDRPA